ncbi:MAG: hypothetical protein UT71_C0031G0006 [Parcubacteria group bacterium GW2011_GWF2_40_10]|nr:MAG: hypothetical protein UT71_C0031G0006 [Parcubacteria group bacterium GW2011_GWF2_40_10]HIG95031.1 hypothetical protein [Nanoarchaeota archaeon]HIH62858.1 hypothetical protein [Nanoarchaeota archaeon]HIJ10275.1 hypothetical protein [Nanoarchaeota archaeon]
MRKVSVISVVTIFSVAIFFVSFAIEPSEVQVYEIGKGLIGGKPFEFGLEGRNSQRTKKDLIGVAKNIAAQNDYACLLVQDLKTTQQKSLQYKGESCKIKGNECRSEKGNLVMGFTMIQWCMKKG